MSAMLQIRSLTPIAIRLPLTEQIKMAGLHMTETENLLVRMEDESGRVGWGEACSAPTMTGETAAGMLAAVTYLTPHLQGLAIEDASALAPLMDRLLYANWAAKSAIETAAFDLMGKCRDLPVYEMLGGKQRASTPILWMLAAGDLETDTRQAQRKLQEGFQAFKVKVAVRTDTDSAARDWERVVSVRQATGDGPQISADANQGYSRDQGLAFARAADAAVLDFFEQPVAAHDLDAMQAIAAAGHVPIGADEGIHSLEDIETHAAHKAAQGVSLKTIKLGGLSAVMNAARRADALGMKINLAGKVADSSIASAAIAHLAVALPQIAWGTSITNQYLARDLAKEPIAVLHGQMAPPEAPGLGIEVDEDDVASFAFRPA